MAQRRKKRGFKTRNINPGRGGFAVTPEKYAPVRRAILSAVPRSPDGITFSSLARKLRPRLSRRLFPSTGSVMWYAKVVQLDLEKHGLLRRIRGAVPQRLRRLR